MEQNRIKKILTTEQSSPEPSPPLKKLVSEATPDKIRRILTGDTTQPEKVPSPAAAPEVTGNSYLERLKNATLAKGLPQLPLSFGDSDGDWKSVKSVNPFEVLYLDYLLYEQITPDMVDRNYRLIDKFWSEKIALINQGAARVQIIRKYAGEDGSEKTVSRYRENLRKSYNHLKKAGVEAAYRHLIAERKVRAREEIDPIIIEFLADNVLDPNEERTIKNIARQKTDLNETEINDLIEEFLASSKSIRGMGGGGVQESERLFFHQIKKKLGDDEEETLLTKDGEEDLRSDSSVYNIPPQRFEQLILQALREVDNAERESTLQQDMNRFHDFYYALAQEFGLTNEDELTAEAKEKLLVMDNSETDFFPLSKRTRDNLIYGTKKEYISNLQAEKENFYKTALDRLAKFEGHSDQQKELLADLSYTHLLPAFRAALISDATDEIIDRQSEAFTESGRTLYRIKHWKVKEVDLNQFVRNPSKIEGIEEFACDWLMDSQRRELLQSVSDWAVAEYERERAEFENMAAQGHKKFKYGFTVEAQSLIEDDEAFHLDLTDRREIISKIEQPLRTGAAEEFAILIDEKTALNTLIPEIEEELIGIGRETFILTEEKNKISCQVRTFSQVIESLRKPFNETVAEKIREITLQKTMDDELVKEFNLPHKAYISENDFDDFCENFKPENTEQYHTVEKEMKSCAVSQDLHISSSESADEFSAVLEKAVERKSSNYKRGLKKWLDSSLTENLVRVGAAYGVPEIRVESKIDEIRKSYPAWTLPNWKRFFFAFFSITVGIILLRYCIGLAGFTNWLFINNLVEQVARSEFLAYKDYAYYRTFFIEQWWIVALVDLTVVAYLYYLLTRFIKKSKS